MKRRVNREDHPKPEDTSSPIEQLRNEHALECDGNERCTVCRELNEPLLVPRLILARREYTEKAESLDVKFGGALCIYCGAPSKERDHLLPRHWTGMAVRRIVPTVPACSQCNRIILDLPDQVIASRSAHVARTLRHKYRSELSRGFRTEDELAEFGWRLQASLRAAQFQRQQLHVRIAVLELGGLPEVPESFILQMCDAEYGDFLRWNGLP